MTYSQWCENTLNYKTISTFYDDFTIAEAFGVDAIKDTYERAMLWKNDYKMMTELCMVLNHKIWLLYEKNEKLAKVYDELWRTQYDWCFKNLNKKELEYFCRITD